MSSTEEKTGTTKSKIVTIPNIMSLFRILLIPLIVWLYCVKERYGWTIAVLLLSGATDIVDGWVARRFDMRSDLGKVLDPVADKLTQAATLLCLVTEFPLMMILFVALLIKETTMGVTGALVIKKTGVVFGADWHGKLTTCTLYFTMLLHIFWHDIPPALSNGLIVVSVGVMILSLTLYSIRNWNQMKSGGESLSDSVHP